MKFLTKQDLIILDDFGIKQFDGDSRLFLLELLEDRSGVKSTIIASQVPVANWFDVIGGATISDAICDRIVHSAHTVHLLGDSWRKRQGKNSGQNLPLSV